MGKVVIVMLQCSGYVITDQDMQPDILITPHNMFIIKDLYSRSIHPVLDISFSLMINCDCSRTLERFLSSSENLQISFCFTGTLNFLGNQFYVRLHVQYKLRSMKKFVAEEHGGKTILNMLLLAMSYKYIN